MGGNLIAARILVLFGACIILAALIPIRRLLEHLPPGKVRNSWNLLLILTLFFVAGYVFYGIVFLKSDQASVDLIVPIIFFCGSIFVMLSSVLSLQTAVDIRRVTMLEQENVTDALTGIFNRRYLDRRLYEEFARAERYKQPLSILLMDLDNFKAVNDAYGHLSGDQALVSFARMMMDTLRAGDVIARFGGDEFMVIATNTAGPEAHQLAERIRKTAEARALEISDEAGRHVTVRITASIGVACYGEKFDSVQAFLAVVDQMMYQAKNEGRNRAIYDESCGPAKENIRPREQNLTL
jgi:diguanylate cyclase (GGDEF)-like protein